MKAWLERVRPAGDHISLPDDSGSIIFGRSSKATLVVDDSRVSARHCSVTFEGGFWRVRDLGSENGTRVNGSNLVYPRALFRGDLIELGGTQLRFGTEAPADDPTLIAAIAKNPDLPEPWLVYADWLLERGDPLGDRIVRTRRAERVDHLPWLGPLWDPFVSGEIELEWQFGFIKRATIRPVVGHLPLDWKDAVSTLLGLRIGQLTRELVIDLPGLRNRDVSLVGVSLLLPPPVDATADVLEAQRYVANLPSVPPSLTSLKLGYQIEQSAPGRWVIADQELAARLPALAGSEVFTVGKAAQLRQLKLDPGVKTFGVSEGVRTLTDVTRLRRASKDQLHFETPPGIPFVDGGNPCYLAPSVGRWHLVSGRLRGEIRVNARVDTVYLLMPGDVIDVQAAGKFRFEVAP